MDPAGRLIGLQSLPPAAAAAAARVEDKEAGRPLCGGQQSATAVVGPPMPPKSWWKERHEHCGPPCLGAHTLPEQRKGNQSPQLWPVLPWMALPGCSKACSQPSLDSGRPGSPAPAVATGMILLP